MRHPCAADPLSREELRGLTAVVTRQELERAVGGLLLEVRAMRVHNAKIEKRLSLVEAAVLGIEALPAPAPPAKRIRNHAARRRTMGEQAC